MKKLKELISLLKCSVSVEVNSHRDVYESVETYCQDRIKEYVIECFEKSVYEKMVELDTIVEVTVYQHTPIGFFTIYHYDLETAIDEALKEVKL